MQLKDLVFVFITFSAVIDATNGIQCFVCKQEEKHCVNEDFELYAHQTEIKDGCTSCGREYALLWDFIEAVNRTCETKCEAAQLTLDHAELKMDWNKACCYTDYCNSAMRRISDLHVMLGGAILGLLTFHL